MPDVDDTDLVVSVRCDDDAAATSSVFAAAEFDAAEFDAGRPVVLRHLVAVPESAVESVTAAAASLGYVATETLADDPAVGPSLVPVALSRVQTADVRAVSQERSRVASIASRCGGVGAGWAVLDVPGDR